MKTPHCTTIIHIINISTYYLSVHPSRYCIHCKRHRNKYPHPSLYNYYPHNQHLYLLSECASQQVPYTVSLSFYVAKRKVEVNANAIRLKKLPKLSTWSRKQLADGRWKGGGRVCWVQHRVPTPTPPLRKGRQVENI